MEHNPLSLGLGPDRTESYPLLAVRKPASTVAGDRRGDAEGGPLGVLGLDRRRGWETEVGCHSRSRDTTSFVVITALQKEVTASHAFAPPRIMASTSARRERLPRRRSPHGGHVGAPPKRGTSSPYAPPYPPDGPHSGDTRTFRPAESDAETSRNECVR